MHRKRILKFFISNTPGILQINRIWMKHFCSTSHIEKNKSLFKFVFLLIYLLWFRNIGLYNGSIYMWNLSYPDTHLMGIGECMPSMWEVWSSSTSGLACCGQHGQFWGHYSFFSSVTIPSAPWDNVYWDNMSLFDVTLFAYSFDGIHMVARKTILILLRNSYLFET